MSVTLRIFSNMHIKNEVANVKPGDWIVLENSVSRMRWRAYFKKQNINEASLNITYITVEEYFKLSKKFSVIVANPPYQGKAELHQRFFNKAVDLVEDDGYVTFIQPATQYQNKKETIRANARKMIENVKKYHTSVDIIPGKVFENAEIFTDLSITKLRKTEGNQGKLDSYTYMNGTKLFNIDVELINKLGIDINVFGSLRDKILKNSKDGNNLQSIVTEDLDTEKFYIQKVRGNMGKHDFYSIISAVSSYWTISKDHDYGLAVSHSEKDSLVSYLKSYIARFALSIYKFNGNNHMGELKSVPLVPFDRIWNDKLLCEYFDITDVEYQEILRCIPDYYGLGDNLG